jgi:uncharacterized protein YecE (DUF72 family)
MSELRIGTSGWAYKDWAEAFYPKSVRIKDRLAYYATRFTTTEINGSFYRLPNETTVAAWAQTAPPGFLFAWKASRFITHNKKLRGVEASLDLVFGRMAPLGEHFGPVLFQLPPMLKRDDGRLRDFLALLPRERSHTVEFRDPAWYAPEVLTLLGDHGVALCISDHHHAPAPWEATARHVYIRGHGPGGAYRGRYPRETLRRWAKRIDGWRGEGREVFAYFDNDIGAAAPKDAAALVELTA